MSKKGIYLSEEYGYKPNVKLKEKTNQAKIKTIKKATKKK